LSDVLGSSVFGPPTASNTAIDVCARRHAACIRANNPAGKPVTRSQHSKEVAHATTPSRVCAGRRRSYVEHVALARRHTTSSTLSGNIDPRQMQELPLNGRNWMDLALLAPGSRPNEGGIPDNRQGYSQINLDGQAVTQLKASTGDAQPKFSRDAIAEFELITNRFDATQGRSAGLQVNAITKSGSNILAGTLSSYFRDGRFNAADFIQQRVLPYSNQQLSTTSGVRSGGTRSTSSATTNTSASRRPSRTRARSRASTSTSPTPAGNTSKARDWTFNLRHRPV
jgi:hypothetical protein